MSPALGAGTAVSPALGAGHSERLGFGLLPSQNVGTVTPGVNTAGRGRGLNRAGASFWEGGAFLVTKGEGRNGALCSDASQATAEGSRRTESTEQSRRAASIPTSWAGNWLTEAIP